MYLNTFKFKNLDYPKYKIIKIIILFIIIFNLIFSNLLNIIYNQSVNKIYSNITHQIYIDHSTNSLGSILEDGISITTETILQSGHSKSGYNKSIENQNQIKVKNNWRPTQYSSGDIIGKKYTVQLGDTLWEIAKGYYGNTDKWIDILKTNFSKIGFLKAQHILIIPSQIINLP